MGVQKNLFTHAQHDEDYNLWGGNRGDQIGYELNARTWFDNAWACVYRPNDETVAERLAVFMENAVLNGFIGYSSNRKERDTLFTNVSKIGFNVGALNELSHCDCASLIYCNVYAVFGVSWGGDPEEPNTFSPLCRHYEDYFDNHLSEHFTKLTDEIYLTGDNELKRGDIVVSPTHVAMWV